LKNRYFRVLGQSPRRGGSGKADKAQRLGFGARGRLSPPKNKIGFYRSNIE